jgi:hypothetical protein
MGWVSGVACPGETSVASPAAAFEADESALLAEAAVPEDCEPEAELEAGDEAVPEAEAVLPEVDVPEVEVPEVEVPEAEVPEVEVPEAEVPEAEAVCPAAPEAEASGDEAEPWEDEVEAWEEDAWPDDSDAPCAVSCVATSWPPFCEESAAAVFAAVLDLSST